VAMERIVIAASLFAAMVSQPRREKEDFAAETSVLHWARCAP